MAHHQTQAIATMKTVSACLALLVLSWKSSKVEREDVPLAPASAKTAMTILASTASMDISRLKKKTEALARDVSWQTADFVKAPTPVALAKKAFT
jgi:UDP-3-O-acyl-N-acetylglucosamine deacetylase